MVRGPHRVLWLPSCHAPFSISGAPGAAHTYLYLWPFMYYYTCPFLHTCRTQGHPYMAYPDMGRAGKPRTKEEGKAATQTIAGDKLTRVTVLFVGTPAAHLRAHPPTHSPALLYTCPLVTHLSCTAYTSQPTRPPLMPLTLFIYFHTPSQPTHPLHTPSIPLIYSPYTPPPTHLLSYTY